MKKLELNLEKRKEKGKNASRRMRKNEVIPAVIYGRGDNESLKVSYSDFDKLLENPDGVNVLLDLKTDDWEKEAIIKKIQRDPVYDDVIHIDFLEIDMDKPLKISVPVELVGLAEGVKEGGVLAQQLDELLIESLPKNLPPRIEVDVSELEIGDSIVVGDIEVSDDVDILEEEDQLVANIVLPTEEEEEEEEEELVLEEGEELPEVEGEELPEEEGEEGEEAPEAESEEE